MRKVVFGGVLPALAGLLLGGTGPTSATGLDGAWSVVVITEKGGCDPAYRYNLRIANGRIRYEGDTSAKVDGTVTSNGVVKVTISLGE
ncbi:MAG: hypothetical protein ACK4UO_14455 [Pseudolabrys sp.]